jgi:hypothetical protein
MTSKEFIALEREANDAIEKITGEFKKRIQELYVIAQEKGYGTEFGSFEAVIACLDEDDFETEDESAKAEYENDVFLESCKGFVWADAYDFISYGGYSFVIDEHGNVIFTSVENLTHYDSDGIEDGVRIMFEPRLSDNWKACTEIIAQIERELEIE